MMMRMNDLEDEKKTTFLFNQLAGLSLIGFKF